MFSRHQIGAVIADSRKLSEARKRTTAKDEREQRAAPTQGEEGRLLPGVNRDNCSHVIHHRARGGVLRSCLRTED